MVLKNPFDHVFSKFFNLACPITTAFTVPGASFPLTMLVLVIHRINTCLNFLMETSSVHGISFYSIAFDSSLQCTCSLVASLSPSIRSDSTLQQIWRIRAQTSTALDFRVNPNISPSLWWYLMKVDSMNWLVQSPFHIQRICLVTCCPLRNRLRTWSGSLSFRLQAVQPISSVVNMSNRNGLISWVAQHISTVTRLIHDKHAPDYQKQEREKLYPTKPGSLKFRGLAPGLAFESGKISNFKGLVTLTLDQVILHIVVNLSLTSTYMPNFIEIKETFCGRMYVRNTYAHTGILHRLYYVDSVESTKKLSFYLH